MRVGERLRAALLVVLLVLAAPWVVEGALNLGRDAYVFGALAGSQDAALSSEFVNFDSYDAVRVQEELGVCSFESGLSASETMTRICADLEEKGRTFPLIRRAMHAWRRMRGFTAGHMCLAEALMGQRWRCATLPNEIRRCV